MKWLKYTAVCLVIATIVFSVLVFKLSRFRVLRFGVLDDNSHVAVTIDKANAPLPIITEQTSRATTEDSRINHSDAPATTESSILNSVATKDGGINQSDAPATTESSILNSVATKDGGINHSNAPATQSSILNSVATTSGSVHHSSTLGNSTELEHELASQISTIATEGSTTQSLNMVRCGQPLSWTSLNHGQDKDTAFFSAYYDSRKTVPERPAVVVFGYQIRPLNRVHIYCVLTYSNGTSQCQSEPAAGVGRQCLNNRDQDKKGSSFLYICKLHCESECTDSEIPVSVQMSDGSSCSSKSEVIPVQNCKLENNEEQKFIAVCPSPLYKQTLQNVVQFVEMSRVLGVELVSLYLIPGSDEQLIDTLHKLYEVNGIIQMFKWVELYENKYLHYYGQLLAITDCIYRNMYRYKYIIVEDLDELMSPLNHKDYRAMLSDIDTDPNYNSFLIQNRFFDVNNHIPPPLPCKSQLRLPSYFHRTNQRSCIYTFHFRSKYIVRSEMVVQAEVHELCKSTGGRELHVPPSVAILGHYRKAVSSDCRSGNSVKQNNLLRFKSAVIDRMCAIVV